MAIAFRNPVSALNRLVEVCVNGSRGFEQAARAVRDAHLSAILLEYSSQREQFGKQLMYQVSRMGARPETRGTVAGLAHRRWINVRSALSHDWAVLQECERGDRRATAAYDRTIADTNWHGEVRNLLHDQHAQIKAARRHLQGVADELMGCR